MPMRLATGLSVAFLLAAAPFFSGQVRAQSAFPDGDDPFESFNLPSINQYAPAISDDEASSFRTLQLEARLTEDGQTIEDGLVWRVFDSAPGEDGKLSLIATSEGGSASLDFPPGDYFLHVAFGRAAVSKKLTIPSQGPLPRQSLVLNAGGLRLNARSGEDARIPPEDLRFSIYSAEADASGERPLIIEGIRPDQIVRLNAGTYRVISDYGAHNASVRADIYIEPGQLTEATIEHRAAELTLKLVSEEGGEAIADTAWSVLTASGDPISESVGAFPTLVLAEGDYTAIARNKDRVYQRDFTVQAGMNTDVEVMLR